MIQVTHEDILNFNDWWKQHYKKTCLSVQSYGKRVTSSEKQKFAVSTYHYMKCDKLEPAVLLCKQFIGGLTEHEFRLRNTNKLINLPVIRVYENKKPIMKKKMDDIQKTLRYIPETHLQFWNNILVWPIVEKDIDQD